METTVSRYKIMFGPAMKARRLAAQRAEARIRCQILNTMTALGMPDGHMVGSETRARGAIRASLICATRQRPCDFATTLRGRVAEPMWLTLRRRHAPCLVGGPVGGIEYPCGSSVLSCWFAARAVSLVPASFLSCGWHWSCNSPWVSSTTVARVGGTPWPSFYVPSCGDSP